MFARLFSTSITPKTPLAEVTTPDQLIVANVLESFVTDLPAWTVGYGERPLKVAKPPLLDRENKNSVIKEYKLDRGKRGSKGFIKALTVEMEIEYKRVLCDYSTYYPSVNGKSLFINGIAIDPKYAFTILTKYWEYRDVLETAEVTARRALADMEANEARWNLAEELLNMRRDGNGRLVAKDDHIGLGFTANEHTPRPRRKRAKPIDYGDAGGLTCCS
jgi:hypothetical protein